MTRGTNKCKICGMLTSRVTGVCSFCERWPDGIYELPDGRLLRLAERGMPFRHNHRFVASLELMERQGGRLRSVRYMPWIVEASRQDGTGSADLWLLGWYALRFERRRDAVLAALSGREIVRREIMAGQFEPWPRVCTSCGRELVVKSTPVEDIAVCLHCYRFWSERWAET